MKYTRLSDSLYAYLLDHCSPRDPLLDELAAETSALGEVSAMQIAPEQGALLTLLARLMGATRALEIGTFTGYSSLCIARGLREGGQLLTCDVSAEWTAMARRYWQRAGLADRIELRLGPALETLAALPMEPVFDLAFIDADKISYPAYYEAVLPRLRPGGLLLVDNVLWSGRVATQDATDPATQALRHTNARIAADPRVEAVMLPIADGLTLARRR
ncbi:MAG: class I SAM-dependent methyltransferase [Myxococcales bacterium]|nr:class I SAM-dependent methyltransferase [Myxococcota bacterium]MDW8282882.1 class I SAM-dependent methyltransferase [Myxococcales bacterium]